MRYFFHISDGSELFLDDVGNILPSLQSAKRQAEAVAGELKKGGGFCRSSLVVVADEKGNKLFERESYERETKESVVTASVMTALSKNRLAPRGCLVRVRCAADRYSQRERWFAVGIYFQKLAEAAVCELPQIEPTDIVFARRRLKRAEIEALGLRRGQVVPCSVNDDVESSLYQTANHAREDSPT